MTSNLPLVSIIMPTYNRAGYILETLHSICGQTYTHWELLVLDDGSEDNTEEVVKSVKDSRIAYHRFPKTNIVGRLKNTGIEMAKGTLIAFMDSDDLWLEDKLELQVNALLENKEAGFSYTNAYNFTDNGEVSPTFLKTTEGIKYENMFYPYCIGERGVFIQTIMVWKYLIEKAGYFGEQYIFTDYSFMGNLAYHYTVAIIYKPLLKRRLHANNSIWFHVKEQEDEFLEIIHTYKNKGWLPSPIARESLFRYYVKTGNAIAEDGKKRLAYRYYFKCWMIRPWSIIPLKKIVKTLIQ